MADPRTIAVLGFRPHTYWTAAVALTGSIGAPRVEVRHKIVFAAGKERSVYHQAAEAAPGTAQALIDDVRVVVEANAKAQINALLELLARDGLEVRVAAAPSGGKKLPALPDILRVHTNQHAAEGEFYRDAVAAACGALGLEVRRPIERELTALACDMLHIDRPALDGRLKAMGVALGPPWSEDQRLAMLAAWLSLDGVGAPPPEARS
jgi:hypothetical protein